MNSILCGRAVDLCFVLDATFRIVHAQDIIRQNSDVKSRIANDLYLLNPEFPPCLSEKLSLADKTGSDGDAQNVTALPISTASAPASIADSLRSDSATQDGIDQAPVASVARRTEASASNMGSRDAAMSVRPRKRVSHQTEAVANPAPLASQHLAHEAVPAHVNARPSNLPPSPRRTAGAAGAISTAGTRAPGLDRQQSRRPASASGRLKVKRTLSPHRI